MDVYLYTLILAGDGPHKPLAFEQIPVPFFFISMS